LSKTHLVTLVPENIIFSDAIDELLSESLETSGVNKPSLTTYTYFQLIERWYKYTYNKGQFFKLVFAPTGKIGKCLAPVD
jgi:hypothetical protein